jgi:hypothetical protein
MSDKPYPTDRATWMAEGFGRMFVGAAIGGVVFFGPVIFIVLLYYFSLLLPPESKEAEDPTPDSFSYQIERSITQTG